MTSINELFSEAANYWNLDEIYLAFEEAKQNLNPRARKNLTEREKLYLRGILCGCSPREIARKTAKGTKGGEVYVSRNLYQYFKKLADIPNDKKLNNWRDIVTYCEKCGYQCSDTNNNLNNQILSKLNNCSPLDALVKIVNMGFDNQNNLTVDINIKLTLGTDKQEKLD